jgi:photosystem II stability/assembly factor-like uncharacterized protein
MRGVLLHTSDGGVHWERTASGITGDLFALWGDDDEVYAAGREGTVLRSTDGVRWQRVDAHVPETLVSLAGHGASVWAVGLAGRVVQSRDHGAHWRTLAVGTGDDLTAIAASGDGRLSVVGYWGTVFAYR